ncbi:MAG: HEAT repeat domain-containing protein [Planctomycetes bacterium]|nr:HEAT repeat domain-containing protein [Planctomycetota bacterium]
MKHWFASLLCTAAVAAQQVPDPRVELAAVIAVEEQERDLAQAERLWRDALAGTLAPAVRAYANHRLGSLLVRLGRNDEAQPFLDAAAKSSWAVIEPAPGQDPARERALRDKARELVARVQSQRAVDATAPAAATTVTGLDAETAEQLLWLGEPAAHEVAAALEAMRTADSYHPETGTVLAAVLWRLGGPVAATFLRDARRDARLRSVAAAAASSLRSAELLAVAVEYLHDDEPQLALSVLQSRQWGPELAERLPQATLVEALRKDGPRQRWLLRWLSPRRVDPGIVATIVPIVEQALASTDPEVGAAAQDFLRTTSAQASPALMALLLDRLPEMLANDQVPAIPTELPQHERNGVVWQGAFDAATAAELLPHLDRCLRRSPPPRLLPGAAQRWLLFAIDAITLPLAVDPTPTLLAWLELGHQPSGPVAAWLTDATAPAVLARLDAWQPQPLQQVLWAFRRVELPAGAFEVLRRTTAGGEALSMPMAIARTGHVEAAEWLTAALATVLRAAETQGWRLGQVVDALVELLRRNDAEPVRRAVRDAIEQPALPDSCRTDLLIALLGRSDAAGLAIAGRWPMVAANSELLVTPLTWLLYEDSTPRHSFTDEQVEAVIAQAAAAEQLPEPEQLRIDAVPDRLLPRLVRHATSFEWQRVAYARLLARGCQGELDAWMRTRLAPDSDADLTLLPEAVVLHYRSEIEALLDGPSPNLAWAAAKVLWTGTTAELPSVDRLLTNRHDFVRAEGLKLAGYGVPASIEHLRTLLRDPKPSIRRDAAQRLGERLDRESVPALLALLREREENVRAAAEQALQRIRFYDEHEAHWERVLRGLDASPQSAVEKLLLQAKPGAPRNQRLLALRSLGALGQPEALPFLIDWTQDTDAELAQAALAAIDAIHRAPRR